MPNYCYSKTFTASGSKTQPESLKMPCHWGTLKELTISFPDGCHGVCHVAINKSLHQLYPTNPEQMYALDGFTLVIKDNHDLEEGIKELVLVGYNVGQYPHTITVTFTIEQEFLPNIAEKAIIELTNIIKKIFRIKE